MTTIISASASMPKIRVVADAVPHEGPSGSSLARKLAVAAGSVPPRRRQHEADAVASPSSRPGESARLAATGASSGTAHWCLRRAQPRGPRQMRESRAPQLRRFGETRRRRPVQRSAGHDDVRARHLIMAVDDDEVEAVERHARVLHMDPRVGLGHAGPPPPRRPCRHSSAQGRARPGQRLLVNGPQRPRPARSGDKAPGQRDFSVRTSGASPRLRPGPAPAPEDRRMAPSGSTRRAGRSRTTIRAMQLQARRQG